MDENIKQQENMKENVIAGIVGAFLFSLLGGALYFLIYQIGFIAGICGFVIVVLASFGYQKFSGKDNSKKGIVVSIILLIVVLFMAEYISLSYDIYDEFKDWGISFFDAVEITPDFLQESEVLGAFIKDLVIAYVLGIIASFALIKNKIQLSKKEVVKNAVINEINNNPVENDESFAEDDTTKATDTSETEVTDTIES